MVICNPSEPNGTTSDCPDRSPLCGIALPDFETLAPTITCGNFESFICGFIAIESSSVKLSGRSDTEVLMIANGIRGPLAARANTNKVSLGDTLSCRDGSNVTTPETFATAPATYPPAAAVAAPASDFCTIAISSSIDMPSNCFTSAMLRVICT